MNFESHSNKTFHLAEWTLAALFSNTGSSNALAHASSHLKLVECPFRPCGQLVYQRERKCPRLAARRAHDAVEYRSGSARGHVRMGKEENDERRRGWPTDSILLNHWLLTFSFLSLCKFNDLVNWAEVLWIQ